MKRPLEKVDSPMPPPSAHRSRASTVVIDEDEHSPDASANSALDFQNSVPQISGVEKNIPQEVQADHKAPEPFFQVTSFQPFQSLLATSIHIYCGENFNEIRTVHLELLLCHSPKMLHVYNSAQTLYDQWESFKKLRLDLKESVVQPPTAYTCENMDSIKIVQKLMSLILICLQKFPLLPNQHRIRKAIETITDEYFQVNKNLKLPPSTGGFKKRDYPVSDVKSRLQLMNPEAIQAVASRIHDAFKKIKKNQETKAKQDPALAAAQRKMFLHGFDKETVDYVLLWLYRENLEYRDARNLCNIYRLAEELGIQALAETCLNKLVSAAYANINIAKERGLAFGVLLQTESQHFFSGQEKSGSLADVIYEVFRAVFQENDPPKALRQLTIDAVAESRDYNVLKDVTELASSELKYDLLLAVGRVWCEPASVDHPKRQEPETEPETEPEQEPYEENIKSEGHEQTISS